MPNTEPTDAPVGNDAPPRRDSSGTLTGVLFPRRKATTVLDGDDRVVGEAWCISCGGVLLNRLLTERCTACDHPVSDSIHGDFLIYADHDRVLRLADAARFVKFAAMFLGALVGIGVLGSILRTDDFAAGLHTAFQIMLVGAFMTPLIAGAGIFTLTSRKSANYYRVRYFRREILIRAGLLVAAIVLCAALALYFLPDAAQPMIFTAWAVIPVAIFLRGVDSLLRRVPSLPLATSARLLLGLVWASGVALLTVLLLQRFLSDESRHRDLLMGVTLLSIMGGIGLTGAGIKLLVNVENALRKAAR